MKPKKIIPPAGHAHHIRRAPHLHIVRFFGRVDRLKVDVHGYVTDEAGRSRQAQRDLTAIGVQGEGSGLSDSQSGVTFRCPDFENCNAPLVSVRLLTTAHLEAGLGCEAMPDPNRPWVKRRGGRRLPLHLIAPGQRTEGKATDQAKALCGRWVSGRRLADATDLASTIYETELVFSRPVCTYCLDEALGREEVDRLHARDRLPLVYE